MLKNVVTIRGEDWEADILPETGANPVRLTFRGEAVLRPLEDKSVLAVNPFLWGSPILIPANRTDGGRFSFDGREYHLPLNEARLNNNLHGMMYTLAFPTEKKGTTRRCPNMKTGGRPIRFLSEFASRLLWGKGAFPVTSRLPIPG